MDRSVNNARCSPGVVPRHRSESPAEQGLAAEPGRDVGDGPLGPEQAPCLGDPELARFRGQ
ncbi:hypothetical protein [Lentzea sp. NPDC055074]